MNSCLFIGSKELGLNIFKKIFMKFPQTVKGFVTFDDSNDLRSKFQEIKDYCNDNLIPFYQIKKNPELYDVVNNIKPDFCLVVGWYWIIESDVLDLCEKGFIGMHSSLLPKYRGCSPLVWAIINGEKETGISLFYINNKMDEGDLLYQKSISILDTDYVSDVMKKIEIESENIILKQYPLIISNQVKSFPQNDKDAFYCAQRNPESGKINWDQEPYEIYNFIRAQSKPYPGAFFYTPNGEKIFVYKSEIFVYKYYGNLGQIVKLEDNQILVVCKGGAIFLKICENNQKKFNLKYGDILV